MRYTFGRKITLKDNYFLTMHKIGRWSLNKNTHAFIFSRAKGCLRELHPHKRIWTDEFHVFKVWTNEEGPKKEYQFSNELYAKDLAPKMFQVWKNPEIKEWVTVAEFMPTPLSSIDCKRASELLNSLRLKLEKLGYSEVDWNIENFAFDGQGNLRCFDFESWTCKSV